jgi:hypothetical protein
MPSAYGRSHGSDVSRAARALWGADGGETQAQPKGGGRVAGVLGKVGAAIVRQPFYRMRRLQAVKAPLDAGDHEVLDHLT